MLPGAKGLVYRSKFLAPGNFFRDGFGDNDFIAEVKAIISLNPCFSGGWSRRSMSPWLHRVQLKVLILVLVEDGLGEASNNLAIQIMSSRLNPCFSGGWSQRATSGSVC